jgi:hypothetical protein
MSDWRTLIDQQIQKALEEGLFSNLPGEGKPLEIEENPHAPADMRLAMKMLKDNGYAPDWIMMGNELDTKRNQLLDVIKKGIRAYQGAVQDATRDPVQGQQRRRKAEDAWVTVQKALETRVKAFNSEIVTYNLKVPQGVTHKPQLNLGQEIKRLVR